MKLTRINFVFLASLSALLLTWALVTSNGLVDSLFVPSPSSLWQATVSLYVQKGFLSDIFASTSRVVFAWMLSMLLAIPLAAMMAQYKVIGKLVAPYVDFIRYLPVPVLIPLTILFFGIDETAKIVLLFIGTFFQLILLIIDDLRNLPSEYHDLFYSLNFKKPRKMRFMLAAIAPQIYDNGRITLGWCWTYLVIAELVASPNGIGHMIKEAQRFSNTPDVYVGILTMGVIGFLSDNLFKWFYPTVFPYQSATIRDND